MHFTIVILEELVEVPELARCMGPKEVDILSVNTELVEKWH